MLYIFMVYLCKISEWGNKMKANVPDLTFFTLG